MDNNHRLLWRQQEECREEPVQSRKTKCIKKSCFFGGITSKCKFPLISIDKNADSINYIDEFFDNAGAILNMNKYYGCRNWFLVQDGATPHTDVETMDYLKTYYNVLENRLANSPDFNPIENIFGIVKRER
mgnify:CR=1 FL=1